MIFIAKEGEYFYGIHAVTPFVLGERCLSRYRYRLRTLYFADGHRHAALPRRLGRFAVVFGIIASISFVGIAATPWNLYLNAHNTFVQWAFRAFLSAVVLCLIAILITRGFPRRFAWVFLAFAVLLTAYIFLITVGPAPNTAAGSVIQATGQKIIVYGAIITVLIQSLNVRTLLQNRR
jgi:hypothetical protein